LFDRGAFSISDSNRICVSNDAHGSCGFEEWLMKFHNLKIEIPQKESFYPKPQYTRWHVNEVFKGISR
jgi:putative restriction endonuclease